MSQCNLTVRSGGASLSGRLELAEADLREAAARGSDVSGDVLEEVAAERVEQAAAAEAEAEAAEEPEPLDRVVDADARSRIEEAAEREAVAALAVDDAVGRCLLTLRVSTVAVAQTVPFLCGPQVESALREREPEEPPPPPPPPAPAADEYEPEHQQQRAVAKARWARVRVPVSRLAEPRQRARLGAGEGGKADWLGSLRQ